MKPHQNNEDVDRNFLPSKRKKKQQRSHRLWYLKMNRNMEAEVMHIVLNEFGEDLKKIKQQQAEATRQLQEVKDKVNEIGGVLVEQNSTTGKAFEK